MATMEIYGAVCNVVYVDSTISSAGDGSTPALALASIPNPTSWVANTVFLLRRNGLSSRYTFVSASSASAANVFIVGTPKSGDWLYSSTPAEAITAWGGDANNYAVVDVPNGSTTTTTLNFNTTTSGGLHRLHMISPTTGTTSTSNATHGVRYNSSSAKIFVTNCRLSTEGYALSDPSYSTTALFNSVYKKYIRLTGAQVTFSDNLIEYMTDQDAVTLTDVNAVIIDNCPRVFFHDNKIYSATFAGLFPTIVFANITDCQIWNTEAYFVLMGSTSSNKGIIMSPLSTSLAFTSVDLRNFKGGIKATSSGYASGSDLRYITFYQDSDVTSPQGYVWSFRDIDIDFGELGITGSTTTFPIQILEPSLGSDYTNGVYRPTNVIDNIKITKSNSALLSGGSKSGGGLFINPQQGTSVRNIDINTPGQSSVALGITGTTPYSEIISGNINIRGRLDLTNVGYVAIDSIDTSDTLNTAVIDIDNSTCYINNATFNTGAWTGPQIDLGDRTHLLINNSNIPLSTTWGNGTPSTNGSFTVNNDAGVAGNWYSTNYYYEGRTWSVYRTGGAPASIKFEGLVSQYDSNTLKLPEKPFGGIRYVTQSGDIGSNKTVQIFAAIKNFASPADIFRYLNVNFSVPYISGGNQKRKMYSTRSVIWEPDTTSVWNGEVGLTLYKALVPVDEITLVGETIDIDVEFFWYGVGSYAYLDPKIIIV